MAPGRMINDSISRSSGIAQLSPKALALFCLLLPHLNSHGKMQAEVYTVKGTVAPLIPWLTVEEIEALLQEISEHTNVKYFLHTDGLHYLHSIHWPLHQKLRPDRLGADLLPSYPMQLREGSGSSPGGLRLEVELEVDLQGEEKEEGEGRRVKEKAAVIDLSDPDMRIALEGQRRLEAERAARGIGGPRR